MKTNFLSPKISPPSNPSKFFTSKIFSRKTRKKLFSSNHSSPKISKISPRPAFTMLEALISILIFVGIMIAIFQIYQISARLLARVHAEQQLTQQITRVLDTIQQLADTHTLRSGDARQIFLTAPDGTALTLEFSDSCPTPHSHCLILTENARQIFLIQNDTRLQTGTFLPITTGSSSCQNFLGCIDAPGLRIHTQRARPQTGSTPLTTRTFFNFPN